MNGVNALINVYLMDMCMVYVYWVCFDFFSRLQFLIFEVQKFIFTRSQIKIWWKREIPNNKHRDKVHGTSYVDLISCIDALLDIIRYRVHVLIIETERKWIKFELLQYDIVFCLNQKQSIKSKEI